MAAVPEPRRQLPVRVRTRERILRHAEETKSVGIIGAGRIGQAIAQIALRAGRPVVIAVMWADVPAAVSGLEWDGRIVIDPTNDFDPSDLNGRTSSEVVADLVAPARVVKAGNTFAATVLASDPHEGGGERVIFVSGDDAGAKAEVSAIFEGADFSTIDFGDLASGGAIQQVGGPLAGVNLVRLA